MVLVGVPVGLEVKEPVRVTETLDAPLAVPVTVFETVALIDPVTELLAVVVTVSEFEPLTVTVVDTVFEFELLEDGWATTT